ncbi:MAG: TrbG/VirB9 family P-type conjugative transfer protein [Pseudomonadota bacterium]|mgnify:CR=1 FL=1
MTTRNLIENILPKALPLAIGFSIIYSGITYNSEALAAVNIDHARLSMEESASDSAIAPVRNIKRKPPKTAVNNSPEETAPFDMPDDAPTYAPSDSDSKVKELVYNESNVYVVRAKHGYQTNIVFDSREEVQTISIGDRSLWQVIPASNRLFIRPMTENISTNMTVLTNKRSYEFDLKSLNEGNDSNVYVLKFTYPEANPFVADNLGVENVKTDANALVAPVAQKEITPGKSSSTAPVSEAATPESIGLLPIRFNYSYTYSGPDVIAPTQVYDDGKNTFIKYKSIGKLVPEAFIIEADGRELRIPATVSGSSLIIDGVAGELALRDSDGEIRVYNESLSGR